jgi:hypothetical protein
MSLCQGDHRPERVARWPFPLNPPFTQFNLAETLAANSANGSSRADKTKLATLMMATGLVVGYVDNIIPMLRKVVSLSSAPHVAHHLPAQTGSAFGESCDGAG